ncbi:DUF2817 domain-containing protein [Conexibacter sp. SYSU D00693]|uniref:DUF2817 domain-containing protein n=1 Tax=Conexibacter sp. SYSU D00693 TaxID=2812560 RepID=UPI00196A4085|nr:DUF2817 domain-containing protein [Conexibacter sp. SYSU D00693]
MLAADLPPALPQGRSVEGRPLRAHCRGATTAPRRLLVVAAVHGDEPGTQAVTRALRRRTPPAGLRVCVVPALNPDGLRDRRRTNARGVDLNRNFPSADWRTGPRGRYFPGRGAASEPETRWAMRLVDAYRPTLTAYVHQPYGIVVDTPTAPRRLLRTYTARVGLPLRRLGRLRGTAVAWQRRNAFVVELPATAPLRAARHAAALLDAARG